MYFKRKHKEINIILIVMLVTLLSCHVVDCSFSNTDNQHQQPSHENIDLDQSQSESQEKQESKTESSATDSDPSISGGTSNVENDNDENTITINNNDADTPSESNRDDIKGLPSSDTIKAEMAPLELYKKLFKQKRKNQLEAVKTIVNIGGYDKQYKMVKMVFEKMFKVLTESRVVLMEAGFSPGDPFPEEMKTKEALSSVAENTVFFGDILLRLPDIAHSLLNKNREWELAAKWGIGLCNDTNILDSVDGKILSLMGQELGIIEKSSDYVNPNKMDVQQEKVKEELESLINEKFKELKKQERKKKRKEKLKKGPKLSGVRHTEL